MESSHYIVKKLYCIFDTKLILTTVQKKEYNIGLKIHPTDDYNNIDYITLVYSGKKYTITRTDMPKLSGFLDGIKSDMYLSNMCEDLFSSISNVDIETKKTIYKNFLIDESITLVDFFISGLCSYICLLYLFEHNLIENAPIINLPLNINTRKYLTKNYTSLISLYINYLCYVNPNNINFYLCIDMFINIWGIYMIEGQCFENSIINKVSVDILMSFIKKSTELEKNQYTEFINNNDNIKNDILCLTNKINSLYEQIVNLEKSSNNFFSDTSSKIKLLLKHKIQIEKNIHDYYHNIQTEFFEFCKIIKNRLNFSE